MFILLYVLQDTDSVKQSPHSPNKVLTAFKGGDHRHSTKYLQSQDLFSSRQCVDVKTKPSFDHNGVLSKVLTTAMTIGMNRNEGQHVAQQESKSLEQTDSYDDRVLVKTEPDSGENTPHPCTRSPIETCAKPSDLSQANSTSAKTVSTKNIFNGGPPKAKRRRYSIPTSLSSCPPRSSSYSDDAGDDLSLSAEDCISGVISTPHIKPLEEEDRVITTPSPVTNPPPIGNKPVATSSANSVSGTRTDAVVPYSRGSHSTAVPPPSTAFVSATTKVQQRLDSISKSTDTTFAPKDESLFQDLDDFTKIMEMVTKEQIAIERQASLTPQQQQQQQSRGAQSRDAPPRYFPRPCIVSPPPYYPPATQSSAGTPTQIPRLPPTSQTSYHASTVQPYRYPVTPVPRRMSEGQQYLSDNMEFRHTSHQQTLHPTVDSGRIHKHPQSLHLPGLSSRIVPQQLQQGVSMSPTIRPTPHTPIATRGFQDASSHCPISTATAPAPTGMNSQHPQTPTTPLEHFSAFTMPPSQVPPHVQSPTQSRQFFPQAASTIGSYQYSQTRPLMTAVSLSSPAGLPTSVGSNWPHPLQTHPSPQLNSSAQQGSLKETLLAQVNSRLEMITGQKHTPGQDIGFTAPPHLAAGPPHPSPIYSHTHSSLNGPQLGTKYSAVGTTMSPVINSTGLPLSHTLTYQSHSHTTGTFPRTHHPSL